MKPVMQTRVGNAVMTPGNCFVACIASLLDLDSLQGLPDESNIACELATTCPKWPSQSSQVQRNRTWKMLWKDLQVFLLEHYGFWMIDLKSDVFKLDSIDEDRYPQLQAFHIVSGQSPRGPHQHSCVARGGKIIHDPHPDATGLLPESESNPYEHTFFVCVNPAPEDFVYVDPAPENCYSRCSIHTPEGYEQCTRETGHDGPCAHSAKR